jgi:DNA recombination protein RmuC
LHLFDCIHIITPMPFDQIPIEGIILFAIIGWVLFLCAIAAWVIARAKLNSEIQNRAHLADQFKILSSEALNATNETFLNIAQERFKNWEQASAGDLEKRQTAINEIVKPVKQQLENLGGAVNELRGTSNLVREDLQMLSQNTLKLAGAMNNPAMRGRWGEMLLDRLLEKTGMVRGIHYDTQTSLTDTDTGSKLRPDIIINLQDGFRIAIDAKAPIQDILDDMDDPKMQDKLRIRLADQVRGHIRALGSKSYQDALAKDGGSVDFTVLFLPGEHLFSLAIAGDPKLIDFAADNNIVLTSPSLLLSLLRVVHLSWRQGELAENAQKIADTGRDLYKSLSSFTGHLDKIGTNLTRSVDAYNGALGSLERNVFPKARRFEELQAAQASDTLNTPNDVDKTVREIGKVG